MLNLNCKGRLLVSAQPVVMGILNITPDSFYTKGRENSVAEHVDNADKMMEAGAAIIDIGGLSTRPGAIEISETEESDRVLPVIESIKKSFPGCFLSIDTYRSMVAAEAVQAGADIVNDISAGNLDGQMLSTVGSLNVPYIAMHMKGTPRTMQQNANYDNVTFEVLEYFIEKIKACKEAGIKDIILDPGFGFAKTSEHNFRLLKELHTLKILELPVLAGVSRKSMIYKLLKTNAENALNGTTALHMLALQQGAEILRVHDVKEAMECIRLFTYYKEV
ncbi:dihydropteroate synthase [Taibaiella lutea]|uniref:dihydropteroate synthase n=1 Tax=Taibaiella lutea TaxID=2608001 RepID=A0A5M6CPL3_9BACT|nr:dihydropteroate synthase [Taibaiella lutea]KAA5537017.1 dihydropteroate synthase [Taibaiella lutea]